MSRAIIEHSRRNYREVMWIGALALLAGCADSPEGILGTPPPPGGPASSPRPRTAALISAPSSETAEASAIVLGTAYVSMVPGTEPGGDSVTIVQLRDGSSVGTRMTNGGFDPVAVEADTGDTLAISVLHSNGATSTTYGLVPLKTRPTVVRTSPATGMTDVPLNNSVIVVIFNEPMDSLSLSDALHLQLHGVDVPGTVTGVSAGGVILSAQFVPTSALEAGSIYQLSISTAAHDLSGASLDSPMQITFTTVSGAIPQPSAAQILAISPTSAPQGSPDLVMTITGANFGSTGHYQSHVMWTANGIDTQLATTFVSSTEIIAVVPAALLRVSGTPEVFLYTGDIMGDLPFARSNALPFTVVGPPPASDRSTIVVHGLGSAQPALTRGLRQVAVDSTGWQDLYAGGSLSYTGLVPGTHQLTLSNPCTSTHAPTIEYVNTLPGETITVSVTIPPQCE